jgi:hypothetical protein
MAGKEHHHVWRMLQRGFGEKRGKDHHIWVYRKGIKPSQKGTGNFGVDRFFYGPEGSETDKRITEFENAVQSGIQSAREMDAGSEIDAGFVAPLIALLEVRSNFLRSELSNLTERMLTELGKHFSSTEKVRAMMKDYVRKNPKTIDAFLAKSFVPVNQRGYASKLFEAYIDNLPPDTASDLFGKKIVDIVQVAKFVPERIKEAHNKSILLIESDSPRIKALEEFSYTVYRSHCGQLILPDTCVAFVGPKNVAPFSQPKDNMQTVIIPISTEVAIIGQKGENRPMELKAINRLLAGCAFEAFIAKGNDPKLAALAGRIGKFAKLMSDKEVRELFSFARLLSG